MSYPSAPPPADDSQDSALTPDQTAGSGAPQPRVGAFPPAPPPGHEKPRRTGESARATKRPWLSGVAVTAVVLVCAAVGVVFVTTQLGQAHSKHESKATLDDSIKNEFDKDNAEFYTATNGVADSKHQLSDGKFQTTNDIPTGSEIAIASDPVYSDVDGDGDLDAAMLLEDTGDPGEDNSSKSVHIWLWDDGVTPVKQDAGRQWVSVSTALQVTPGEGLQGFKLKRDMHNDPGNPAAENVDVRVEDGLPVIKHGKDRGGIRRCWRGKYDLDMTAVTSDPLLLPDPEAAKVGGKQREVTAVISSDWEPADHNDYALVAITFVSGEEGCGWIPYEEYEAAK